MKWTITKVKNLKTNFVNYEAGNVTKRFTLEVKYIDDVVHNILSIKVKKIWYCVWIDNKSLGVDLDEKITVKKGIYENI